MIDNFEITIRLRVKVNNSYVRELELPFEEFHVNFLELMYLARDLKNLSPYAFPLIVFKF